MNAMLEAIQDVVAAENVEPEVEVQTVTAQDDDAATETQLVLEISDLWANHSRLSQTHKTTAVEIRQIRASLAERLFAMKAILSRPGRGGQWKPWLLERGIPRSTADRLVARHAEALGVENGNDPSEAISEPPMDTAEKLAKNVWRRFGKLLTTDESILQFIGGIVTASRVAHEWRDEGLVIFNPVLKAADEVAGFASATGPAPQPADDADAIAEEPRDEAAAAGAGESHVL
jgi:hypothetical protein